MLHLLYGFINTVDKSKKLHYLRSLASKEGAVSDVMTGAAITSFATHKPLIFFSDEHFALSCIGHIYLAEQNQTTLSARELIQLFQQHGKEFLSRLSGHFCLFIMDKQNNVTLLANDAMATLPLYYTLSAENSLTFSSKMDVLVKSPGVDNSTNAQGFYNYIYFHMIPSPGTIYQSIEKLEPAQYVYFDGKNVSVQTYWTPEFSESTDKSTSDLARSIFDTLEDSTAFYTHRYPGCGSFLSGGLDSSAISGMLSRLNKEQTKTFSIGFPVKAYNEIEYARIASSKFNTQQIEYFIQPVDVITHIDKIVDYLDEPFGNSSIIPTFYCAKLAYDNGVSTLLAGDGGDELFAGNTRYAKQQIFEQYFKVPALLRHKMIEPILRNKFFTSNYVGHKAMRYVEQANIQLPERLETYNFLFINDPGDVFKADFLEQIDQHAPLNLIEQTYFKSYDASYLNKMLYTDWKHTLADNDLRKVNMMCELAGVNVEYPMLSNEMIELSNLIPSRLKLTPSKLRYLYKRAMDGFLPSKIINKPKHGFGLPFGVWTQTEKKLQEVAYDTINSLGKYHIFEDAFLRDAISKHQGDHAAFYGELVWILMILGLWLEKHQ